MSEDHIEDAASGSGDGYRAPDWTSTWDPKAIDAMYHKMLGMEGPVLSFALQREIADEKTFSPEAIDEVLMAMRAWFYSRPVAGVGRGHVCQAGRGDAEDRPQVSRCPYCEYETPEPDDGDAHVRAWQEVAHMETEHPDVIRERLDKAGLLDFSTRFEQP